MIERLRCRTTLIKNNRIYGFVSRKRKLFPRLMLNCRNKFHFASCALPKFPKLWDCEAKENRIVQYWKSFPPFFNVFVPSLLLDTHCILCIYVLYIWIKSQMKWNLLFENLLSPRNPPAQYFSSLGGKLFVSKLFNDFIDGGNFVRQSLFMFCEREF